jgi:hypothetical protein
LASVSLNQSFGVLGLFSTGVLWYNLVMKNKYKNRSFRVVATCVVLAVLGMATAYAFSWSTESVTGATFSESLDVVVQSATQQDVSYVNASADAYYAEQVSGVWTKYAIEAGTLPDGDVAARFQGSSITIDTGDVPVVTFTSNANDDLWIARDDGTLSNAGDSSSWTYDKLYDTASASPSMGINSASVIGVAFTSGSDLYYAYEGGSTCALAGWTCEQVEDSANASAPRLYFNGATPIIAFTTTTTIEVAVRDGGGSGNCTHSNQWNCYVVDAAVNTSTGRPVGVSMNASSQIILSYIDNDGTTLMYAVNDGGDATCTHASWSCSTVSSATNFGYPVDLEWDATGDVPFVMANDDTNGDLEIFYNDGTWQNNSLSSFGFNDYAAMDISGNYVGVVQYTSASGGILGYHDTTTSYTATPLLQNLSAVQKTDGSGAVDISVEVDDNDDDEVRLKLEYKAGSDCSSGTSDPTLDEAEGVTATEGTPDVENDNEYQVGTASGIPNVAWNTVEFDWLSATDVATANETYCIKVTPFDANDGAGTAATTTLTLDNVVPTDPGSFSITSSTETTASLEWTVSTDTNFDHYELWYSADEALVNSRTNTLTFTETSIDATVSDPESVFSYDVNGDGYTDVLVAAQSDNALYYYENNGTGSFTRSTIDGSYSGASNVFALDIDLDGDIDVLATASWGDEVTWYENNGSESFTENTIATGVDYAYNVDAADLDEDGDIDIVAGGIQDTTLTWWENDGSQSFSANTLDTDYVDGVRDVDIADIDSDGDNDIFVIGEDSRRFVWYDNDGAGSFTETTISTDYYRHLHIYAIDLDDDTDMDVVTSDAGAGVLSWWENDGSETFTRSVAVSSVTSTRGSKAVDLNGDGYIDVLVTGAGKIMAGLNDGSETFSASTVDAAFTANDNDILDSGDFDMDGDIDIVAVGSDGTVKWYDNDGYAVEIDDGDESTLANIATTTITISNLVRGVTYYFERWAVDTYGNESTAVPAATSYSTGAAVPGTPELSGATAGEVTMDFSPSGNAPSTVYAIYETSTEFFVQADGTLGAGEVLQTYVVWDTPTVTGLTPNTEYTFKVKAKDGNGTETAYGSTAAKITLANSPGAATATVSSTSISVSWGANSNPAGTEYLVTGSNGASSGWITTTSWTDASTRAASSASYTVQSRNGDSTTVATTVTSNSATVPDGVGSGAAARAASTSATAATAAEATAEAATAAETAAAEAAEATVSEIAATEAVATAAAEAATAAETAATEVTAEAATAAAAQEAAARVVTPVASVPEPAEVTSTTEVATDSATTDSSEVSATDLAASTTDAQAALAKIKNVLSEGEQEKSPVRELLQNALNKEKTDTVNTNVFDENPAVEDYVEDSTEDSSEDSALRDEGWDEESSDNESDWASDLADVVADIERLVVESSSDDVEFQEESRQVFESIKENINPDADSDRDGISNAVEVSQGSNPYSADSDGDGVHDGVEARQGSSSTDSSSGGDIIAKSHVDKNADTDRDGISDVAEASLGLDVNNDDADDDGVKDSVELVFGGGDFDRAESEVSTKVSIVNLNNPVVSSGGFVVPGMTSLPNTRGRVRAKNLDGKVIAEVEFVTDAEGKFVAPFAGGDFDSDEVLILSIQLVQGETAIGGDEVAIGGSRGGSQPSGGDEVAIGGSWGGYDPSSTVKSKSMIAKVSKQEIKPPKVKSSGAGVELIAKADLDQETLDDIKEGFDVLPDMWYKVLIKEHIHGYIDGTSHESAFVESKKQIVEDYNNNNVLIAGVAPPNTAIYFTFESLITTSVVISDSDGKYELPAPEGLEKGVHAYTGFYVDYKNNAVSSIVEGLLRFDEIEDLLGFNRG